MNLLVTAGNTQTPIDRVRCITNIFTGKTGANIALEGWRRGHAVRLLTSHPAVLAELARSIPGFPDARWAVNAYRTFDELHDLLEAHVRGKKIDVIMHAAAINDYRAAGIFAPDERTRFDPGDGSIQGRFVDRSAGKVKSDEPELWLRLTRAPKLVDYFREPWGFAGTLVKFKLEVGKTVEELTAITENSRLQSRANLMVANTLEGASDWALIGPIEGRYQRVPRDGLAHRLLEMVENMQQGEAS